MVATIDRTAVLFSLLGESASWAQAAFGVESVQGLVEHLTEEIAELALALDNGDFNEVPHEVADCLMLTYRLGQHLEVAVFLPSVDDPKTLDDLDGVTWALRDFGQELCTLATDERHPQTGIEWSRDARRFVLEGVQSGFLMALLDIAAILDFDAAEAVREKHLINLGRRWTTDAEGRIRHIPDPLPTATSTIMETWRGRVPASHPDTITDDQWNMFIQHVEHGVSMTAIAKEHKLTRERVRQILDTTGLKLETRAFTNLPLAVANILYRALKTPAAVRETSDDTLLAIPGLGVKRLELIRSQQNTWE